MTEAFRVADRALARPQRPSRRTTPDTGVRASRVPPVALDHARRLADGDLARIEIVSATSLIVWNHPAARYRRRTA